AEGGGKGAPTEAEVVDELVDHLGRQPGADDLLERIEAFGDELAGAAHAGEIGRSVQLDLPVILVRGESGVDVIDHGETWIWRLPPRRARRCAGLDDPSSLQRPI